MGIIEVSQKEFDNLIKNSLKLHGCPHCGRSVDVILELPIYGASKVGFKCRGCGHEVTGYCHSTPIATDEKFGTPITPLGLAKDLFNVAELWNTEAEELQNDREDVEYIRCNLLGDVII